MKMRAAWRSRKSVEYRVNPDPPGRFLVEKWGLSYGWTFDAELLMADGRPEHGNTFLEPVRCPYI